jgi:hypothetical protein
MNRKKIENIIHKTKTQLKILTWTQGTTQNQIIFCIIFQNTNLHSFQFTCLLTTQTRNLFNFPVRLHEVFRKQRFFHFPCVRPSPNYIKYISIYYS